MIPPPPSLTEQASRGQTVALCGAVAALCLVLWYDSGSLSGWRRTGKWRPPLAPVPAWQQRSARDWFEEAQGRAAEGNFRLAAITINYALASAPDEPEMLVFQGNMDESLFRFQEAQGVYAHVLRVDPRNLDARQNLSFCQRINRYRESPATHPSTLYGLHRVMYDQGRVSEDLAIGRRLDSDRALWQTSWQAALDRTGLQGRITVDDEGAMDLDLTGTRLPNLSLLRGFPLTSLNLSHTGLANVRALRGLPLRKLDLTQTVVDDLAPLAGMPLKVLHVARTGVTNLSPIRGCPLQELDISGTRVFDLSALQRLPLTLLRANDTPINDLSYLAALPLTELDVSRTRIRSLEALRHLPLEVLAVDGTLVDDLSALRGSALRGLYLSWTAVADLSPLQGMPLKVLTLTGCPRVTDLRALAGCSELEHLLLPPSAQDAPALAGLPRVRFVQRSETPLEERMLLSTEAGDAVEQSAELRDDPVLAVGRSEKVAFGHPGLAIHRARAHPGKHPAASVD